MGHFRRVFTFWFVALLGFFALANLATLEQPTLLKPFGGVGFPARFAAWGDGIDSSFDWLALALNLVVAVVVSALVASVCAEWRHQRIPSKRLKLWLFLALTSVVALVYWWRADWYYHIGAQRVRKFPDPLWYQFLESGIVGVAVGGLLALVIARVWSRRTR